MGKEYELYSILLEKKYKNDSHASQLVEAVVKSRRKLSNRRLNNEKYNLIKTIKENYDIKEFFNTRIPNFKIMASVYKLFGTETGKEDFGPVQRTDSVITITEHITQNTTHSNKTNKVVKEFKEQGKDLRLLSYQLLVDKFNSKYKTLNENQKNLLKEYINNVSNTNSLKGFIDSEVVKIKKALKSLLPKVNDKITKIKLSEAIDYTDSATKGKVVQDKHVVALMRYYELIKEIKNVQTRKNS
jgi:cellulose biosynthesis protein BcsQ